MRIVVITAGAAGMYCGSCLRDNALARALIALGHDVLLVPTYTPTRTDEPNVSSPRVFLGGINVYLQHKAAWFRHAPAFLSRWLDSPRLLAWAARRGMRTEAAQLGDLTVSMLQGSDGPSQREFESLGQWLAEEARPDVVDLGNALLLGVVPALRRRSTAPIVCTLSGEDLFVDQLPEPQQTRVVELLRQRIREVDACITFSRYYAQSMADRLQISPASIHCVPLGVHLNSAPERPRSPAVNWTPPAESGAAVAGTANRTIGYLARICPEKGLHLLSEAFCRIRGNAKYNHVRLAVAGWLGDRDRPYFDSIERALHRAGLANSFSYAGEPDLGAKSRFLQSLDLFSVPTVYREAKGFPVLEAMSHGVAVVAPRHGSFPELLAATQGGLLVPPHDVAALTDALSQLLDNDAMRCEMGERGRVAVERQFTTRHMAEAVIQVYESVRP